MSKSVLEAYDLVIFAQQTAKRLAELAPTMSTRVDHVREQTWLEEAVGLLAEGTEGLPALVDRAKWLPELKSTRQEGTGDLVNLWVDALEKLLAGITFHLGSRHPMIEAVFTHQRFPALRRAAFEVATEFAAEIERRLRSAYVERMLAQDDFAFARPVVAQVRATWTAVKDNESDLVLPEEEAIRTRHDLVSTAEELELLLRQARLLAEAAFARSPETLEETGLTAKPRKRPGRGGPVVDVAQLAAASGLPAPSSEPREPERGEAEGHAEELLARVEAEATVEVHAAELTEPAAEPTADDAEPEVAAAAVDPEPAAAPEVPAELAADVAGPEEGTASVPADALPSAFPPVSIDEDEVITADLLPVGEEGDEPPRAADAAAEDTADLVIPVPEPEVETVEADEGATADLPEVEEEPRPAAQRRTKKGARKAAKKRPRASEDEAGPEPAVQAKAAERSGKTAKAKEAESPARGSRRAKAQPEVPEVPAKARGGRPPKAEQAPAQLKTRRTEDAPEAPAKPKARRTKDAPEAPAKPRTRRTEDALEAPAKPKAAAAKRRPGDEATEAPRAGRRSRG